MNAPSPESATTRPPVSLPARIGHELLCAGVAGVFCVFELLVLITELRPAKILARFRK